MKRNKTKCKEVPILSTAGGPARKEKKTNFRPGLGEEDMKRSALEPSHIPDHQFKKKEGNLNLWFQNIANTSWCWFSLFKKKRCNLGEKKGKRGGGGTWKTVG